MSRNKADNLSKLGKISNYVKQCAYLKHTITVSRIDDPLIPIMEVSSIDYNPNDIIDVVYKNIEAEVTGFCSLLIELDINFRVDTESIEGDCEIYDGRVYVINIESVG